jgi:hypothetical protein
MVIVSYDRGVNMSKPRYISIYDTTNKVETDILRDLLRDNGRGVEIISVHTAANLYCHYVTVVYELVTPERNEVGR